MTALRELDIADQAGHVQDEGRQAQCTIFDNGIVLIDLQLKNKGKLKKIRMQFVSITRLGSSYVITIPIDILRYAGLIEETGEGEIPHLKGDDQEVFVQYNPETRIVEFQLVEPPEGAATREEELF